MVGLAERLAAGRVGGSHPERSGTARAFQLEDRLGKGGTSGGRLRVRRTRRPWRHRGPRRHRCRTVGILRGHRVARGVPAARAPLHLLHLLLLPREAHVVLEALLLVCQRRGRLADSLECLLGAKGVAFIGVKLYRQLAVCLAYVRLLRGVGHVEDLV